ncbi:MAG TPA: CaiB/BaiF CoA-transferase family protein [Motiliproteus sp.]
MLSDVKVLDFSTLLPGPYASMMLADLGAEVLRVEAPDRVDLVRELPPKVGDSSVAHQYLNRSKRSIALDLKQPEAVALIHRLVAEYDVVLEQFRPGVMDRLGLGYETLQAINPRLIYCAITGYGQTGPYRDRAGHDINYLALAGISSYSRRSGEPPLPLGIQVADVAGGSLHSVVGILAALHQRQRTGKGQLVDISMTDCAFALNGMSGAAALAGEETPGAESGLLNGGSFYDYYTTADGRHLAVGSLEPKFFAGLCRVLELPELAAIGTQPNRQQALKQALQARIGEHDLAYWQQRFANEDLCVEPVLDLAEAAAQPQLQQRGMVVEVPHPLQGTQRQIGCPIKFSAHTHSYAHAGGELGADGVQVLRELGLDNSTIATLRAQGVLHGAD